MSDIILEKWVNLNSIAASGENIKLKANEEQLSLLKDELDIELVKHVSVDVHLKAWRKGGLQASGMIDARIKQLCVSTLEPIFTDMKLDFKRSFLSGGNSRIKRPEIIDGEMILDPEEEDFPDILASGKLNIWQFVIEEINLAIDPYPRKLQTDEGGENDTDKHQEELTYRPFEGLASLKSVKKY